MRVVSTSWRYPASQGRTRGQVACFQKGEGDVNRSGLRGYEGKRMGQQIACELHANASTESLWSCLRPRSLRNHRRRATLFWSSERPLLRLSPDTRSTILLDRNDSDSKESPTGGQIYSRAQVHGTMTQAMAGMTDSATLPLQAHVDRSAFLRHAWNIGRAYRSQAMELISICQFLSQFAPPKSSYEDAGVRR